MGVFDGLVRMMLEMGVFEVIFPWLIVMSVTYGALEKYEYFEDEMVNGAIALSLGFLTSAGMVMFVPSGLFANLMAAIAFAAIGILGVIILAAIGGHDFQEEDGGPLTGIALLMGVIAFIGAFVYQFDLAGLLPTGETDVWNDAVMPVLTMLFIIILVAVTAGGGGEDGEDDG